MSDSSLITARQYETWPGVMRTALVTAGTVAVTWHVPDVAPRALLVFMCLGLPSLARTVVAPILAFMLRGPAEAERAARRAQQSRAADDMERTSPDP